MGIDWLSATHADRQILYRHAKAIVDRRFSGDWSRFYDAIPAHVAPGGHGDQDNFRAGRISRKRASAIFDGIAARWPDEASAIIAGLGGGTGPPSSAWEAFLHSHADQRRLRLVPLDDPAIGIVAFVTRRPAVRVRLGQPFCFALDSGFAGHAMALQSVQGRWHALPLTRDGTAAILAAGDQLLPIDPGTGAPIPLSEDAQLGPHIFIVTAWQGGDIAALPASDGPTASDRLALLAWSLSAMPRWTLHRLDVTVTA